MSRGRVNCSGRCTMRAMFTFMTLAQMPAALAAWRWRRRYIAGMLDVAAQIAAPWSAAA
jgi:hypothetical protein